jgi:hypothetical protein
MQVTLLVMCTLITEIFYNTGQAAVLIIKICEMPKPSSLLQKMQLIERSIPRHLHKKICDVTEKKVTPLNITFQEERKILQTSC